ncbi:MAG: RlpA-like double-psi beta-barrel domain-containing protein [Anaerolineae bacterium]
MRMLILGSVLTLLLVGKQVTVTSYGIDDRFSNQRTASSWHQQSPEGAPHTVVDDYMGAASNDYPFGTVLQVTTNEACWRESRPERTVTVVIVDRMATGIHDWVDLFPEPARILGIDRDECHLGYTVVITPALEGKSQAIEVESR